MTLAHPQALWWLATLPVAWLLAFSARRDHLPRRLVVATVLRSIVVVLLLFAAAQPRVSGRGDGVSVVYALDVSRSVSPEFLNRSLDWIRTIDARHRPAEARVLVFADRPQRVASVDDVASVAVSSSERADVLSQGATDIEQALRAATAGFGAGHERRLVLVTDGVQTRGDLWRMLPRLQAEHVRVFTVPAAPAVERDAWIDAIVVPPGVRRHEPVTVHVKVHALGAMPARIRLASGTRRLGAANVTLGPGANDIAFETALTEVGETTLTATVRADGDRFEGNDTLAASIDVGPPPRVLYVEGVPESAHHLADALRAHHIDVTVAAPDALASGASPLAGFDAVILSDVFVQSLDAQAAAAIERFVRDTGGGLIFAAGESTYGQEGFAGSALERLLPVRFEGRRKRRDLDLVLLIDRSHSMRGRKLELAKTAALSTLDLLEDRHRLAVVAFDAKPHEVVPLAPVGNKRRAEDLIASMTARGQTSIHPAFVEAQRILATSTATTKHIILLSDGVTAQPPTGGELPDAQALHALIQKGREDAMRRDGIAVPRTEAADPLPEPGAIEALVAALAEAKITVSTVAIGDKPNLGLMGDIAAIGRGRGYVARNDAEIPGLFVTETRRLLGESIVEASFRPVAVHRAPALAGLDFANGPPLRGLVVARPKTFADVLLRAPKDLPLLVTTHYGLGKSTAFLSDVKNRWSADWIGWDGYGRFWAQVVRDAMRRRDDGDLALHVFRAGGDAAIELHARDADQGFRNGLSPVARVTAPDGRASTIVLRPVAPGRYAAHLPIEAGHVQPYRFELLAGSGLTGADVRAAGHRSLAYAWSDEFRVVPPDLATLRALATLTGGGFAPTAADIFALHGDAERTPRPLWPWCVAAALGVFLLDILWRRAPSMPGGVGVPARRRPPVQPANTREKTMNDSSRPDASAARQPHRRSA